VDSDLELNPTIGRHIVVALGQGALDLNGALRGFQGAAEFDEKSVADGFDFHSVKVGKDFAQQAAMFFEQLEAELVVALGQRAVAHHVGEHNGGELALLGVFGRHERIKSETAQNETANPRRSAVSGPDHRRRCRWLEYRPCFAEGIVRSTGTEDHPGVMVFPPLAWLVGAVVSGVVHWILPVRMIMRYHLSLLLGIVLAMTALALILWAVLIMKMAGTNVPPSKPALTIVRNGPYRFTRNPMYLGLCLLQVALGFFLNDWIPLLFAVLLALLLHYGVVLREEKYLEAKFGDQYLALKRNVRRWM